MDGHVLLIQVIYLSLIKIKDTTVILAHKYRMEVTKLKKVGIALKIRYILAKCVLNLLSVYVINVDLGNVC